MWAVCLKTADQCIKDRKMPYAVEIPRKENRYRSKSQLNFTKHDYRMRVKLELQIKLEINCSERNPNRTERSEQYF